MKNTNLQITTHTIVYTVDPFKFLKRTSMLYSTTANLICIDFYVYFPKTAQSTA